MSRYLLQVDGEHGTATVVLDHELTDRQRQLLDELLSDLTDEQRWHLLAILTRQVADERAYERVCQQRGLLL